MSNKYPGYCISCSARVEAGHGELTRAASGAWVVKCGATPAVSTAATGSRKSRGRGGCECPEDCCRSGRACRCDAECNCRGGNIYDC